LYKSQRGIQNEPLGKTREEVKYTQNGEEVVVVVVAMMMMLLLVVL